jgi:hypothetical protein
VDRLPVYRDEGHNVDLDGGPDQGSKLTHVRQSVTDKNPGGYIDFFTYQQSSRKLFKLAGQ